MRILVIFFVLVLAAPAAAQLGPPTDGLYEDFPSIFMQASGPLAAPPSALPRWVDVRTEGGVTTVTFEPEARVAWRIAWGPNGPAEKLTLVDGEQWTRSVFGYDASGHLATKHVTGAGAGAGLTYAYRTDATGRILSRTTTLATGVVEQLDLTYRARGTTVTLTHGGIVTRSDRYDAQRRLAETRLFDAHGVVAARLAYVRSADGSLRSIRRRLGRHHGLADPGHVDPSIDAGDVSRIAQTPIERHEALLLLGAPMHATDTERGVARHITVDYASGCWLNQTSGLSFDAAGSLTGGATGCICGFCVASSAIDPGERARATSSEEHWTAGPWVRIDGVDVTADHALVTPQGPRTAGSLRVGDVVTGADGAPRALRSVEPVRDDGALRLGVNLETPDHAFSAGGLRFVTETASTCAPE